METRFQTSTTEKDAQQEISARRYVRNESAHQDHFNLDKDVHEGRMLRGQSEQINTPLSNFTFVISNGQNGDILAKKIRDEGDRHIIRSRVMRHVRAREQAAGHKRRTGRVAVQKEKEDSKSGSSTPKSTGNEDMQISMIQAGNTPSSSHSTAEAISHTPMSLTWSPGIEWIDPFETLYSKHGPSIKRLVNYSCYVFIPMTFPIESKHPSELRLRRGGFIQTSRLSATFLACLAIAAAHQAIAEGRNKDLKPSNESQENALQSPEYYALLGEAYAIMNQKAERREFEDGDIYAAHFALAGASTSAGNFRESRKQIQLSREYHSRIGKDPNDAGGLPLQLAAADTKAALGRLQAPLYELSWEPQPLDERVSARIVPPSNSPLARSGIKFAQIPGLHEPLLKLLYDLRIVCFFANFDAMSPNPLSPVEHEVFRTKVQEFEHSLLKYPRQHLSQGPGYADENDLVQDPLTAVTRVAALSLLARIACVVQTSAGVGRALTWNQVNALRRWSASLSCRSADAVTLELIVWILFLGIESAEGQKEMAFFEETMAEVAGRRDWSQWESVADSMLGFLYIPALQEKKWRKAWESVQLKAREANTPDHALHRMHGSRTSGGNAVLPVVGSKHDREANLLMGHWKPSGVESAVSSESKRGFLND